MYDSIIIGGGPAGLQAALTLGRMHRQVLLLDSGVYRNGPVEHFHNFLGHDGDDPAQFRAAAHAQLDVYQTVVTRSASVEHVAPAGEGFTVVTGDDDLATKTLLLATGMRDVLPDIHGLEDVWGTLAAACPFCHGHELSGRVVGLLGVSPHTQRLAAMLAPIASELVVFAEPDADAELVAGLLAAGVRVETGSVAAVARRGDVLVVESGDRPVEVAGLFLAPAFVQRARLAEQLALTLLPSGAVEIDAFGRTSRAGVFAAGDMAHTTALPMPMASVLAAAAAGQVAASSTVAHLLEPVPATAGQVAAR